MNEYIAYCGLDCEACEARLATVNNDDVMRQRIAREWSDLNGVEITPEMINCSGCRIPGAKTPYCDSLCPIRKFFILKEHRKELLDTIHANQKALDSLDYLIFQTEKKEGNKR